MQSKSQVIVNIRTGDQIMFPVVDSDGYRLVCTDLYSGSRWIEFDNAIVNKEDIVSVYYLPEGIESCKAK